MERAVGEGQEKGRKRGKREEKEKGGRRVVRGRKGELVNVFLSACFS